MVTWQIKSCTHHLILRKYIVKIDKPLGKKDISSLEKGVPINDNSIGRFNKIINLTNNSYKITLSTGKYREVRYSLQYLNFKTISLHRVSIQMFILMI